MEILTQNKDLVLNLALLWNVAEIVRLGLKSSRRFTLSLNRRIGLKIEFYHPQTECNVPNCPNKPQPESDDRPAG